MKPSTLFFSCRTPEKSTRKAGFEVCGWSLRPVFDRERNKESLSVIWALFSLYCLHTGCFQASNKRFAHVGAERQTNIHTYKHTHFS